MTDKPLNIEDAVDYNNLLSEQMTEVPKSLHERVIDAVYALGRVNAEEGGHNGFVTIMLSRLEAMADEIRELEAGQNVQQNVRELENKVDMSDLAEVVDRQLGRINDQLYSLWEKMR